MIHGFLVRSHWAAGIPFAVMQRAIENSIPWPETREQLVEEAIRDLSESIPAAKKGAMLLFMK